MSLEVDDGVNSPVTTDYTWDANRSLPVVLEDDDNRYVDGLDLIAAVDGPDDETFFLYDGLGSTTELLGDAGDVMAAYARGRANTAALMTDPAIPYEKER